jgi:hypothetical protein
MPMHPPKAAKIAICGMCFGQPARNLRRALAWWHW